MNQNTTQINKLKIQSNKKYQKQFKVQSEHKQAISRNTSEET